MRQDGAVWGDFSETDAGGADRPAVHGEDERDFHDAQPWFSVLLSLVVEAFCHRSGLRRDNDSVEVGVDRRAERVRNRYDGHGRRWMLALEKLLEDGDTQLIGGAGMFSWWESTGGDADEDAAGGTGQLQRRREEPLVSGMKGVKGATEADAH